MDDLTRLARSIESGAVDGRGQALRQALADLGAGLEVRLASGASPEQAPLRALLLALADHPGTDASLGRAAAGLSDAIAAQTLAGPALTATVAANAGPAANGQQADPPHRTAPTSSCRCPAGAPPRSACSPTPDATMPRAARGRGGSPSSCSSRPSAP